MATVLNLFRLIPSDDQQLFTDKCNFNFDQILNMGGGPPGIQGIQGIQGVPGSQGIQGFQGDPGVPGTKWYVENTDPISFGPITPAPAEGDYWFDTNTLNIYQYAGSPPSWTLIGNLTVSGVFKDAIGDSDRVIFSSPTPLKSLVLSPINYGVGAPQTGPYKLKLIGSPGSPQQMFGVLESGAENLAAKQSYISVNTIIANTEYSWELVNPTGNIEFSAFGTSLDLIKQTGTGSISRYEFNSNAFKIQLNPTERLMSFYNTPSGLNWHVGGHNALTSSTERLFSINDSGSIGVANAFSNAVAGDATPYDFRYDQLNVQLPVTAGATNMWARWRAKVSGFNTDQLNFRNVRSFFESSGMPWRSSEMRIEHKTDATYNHFIALGGGATSANTTVGVFTFVNPPRPALRFGTGGTANDGYYFAADSGPSGGGGLPRMWMGDPDYIKTATGTLLGGLVGAKLNVQSYNAAAGFGTSGHSNIHLAPGTGAGDYSIHGITAGHPASGSASDGGLIFQGWDSANTRLMSTSLAAGDTLTAGMRNQVSAWSNGETYFWSRSDGNGFFRIRSGAVYAGTQSNPTVTQMWANDITTLSGYNWSTGQKSIVINDSTNYSGFGDGFVGIGDRFSEYITAGPAVLTTGKWYKGPWSGAPVHNGIDYLDFVPFQAANATLTAGTVVEAKPQTKFQVYGAVTIGSRSNILNYASDVGDVSFTVGTNNKAAGLRSVVLGGNGNQSNANDAIMIGWSGSPVVNTTFANTISLVTATHASTAGPASYLATTLFAPGDISFGTPRYRISSSPIIFASTAVPVPQFGVVSEVGDMARVLLLEGRNTGTTFGGGPSPYLTGIPVMLEYAVKNGSGAQRSIGAVMGEYYEVSGTNPTNQRGRISIAVNSGASLYPVANFSASGLQFIGQFFKPKISVAQNGVVGGSGIALSISGGAANTGGGPATGGHVLIDAGPGANTGLNGIVAVGAAGSTYAVNITPSTQVTIGSISSGATVQLGNANSSDVVQSYGSVQAVKSTFVNPGPTASSFVGISTGGSAPIVATQSTVGDALIVTFTKTGVGTTTVSSGVQLFHLEIAAVAYDRTIVAVGSGNSSGLVIWELRLNGTGGTMYRRQLSDVHGGIEFLVPAGNKVAVRLESTYPGYGSAFTMSGSATFSYFFRAFKHGL
jgi:hypothetical protein